MSRTINVLLTVKGEEDVLIFDLDDENPDDYSIDLNSESNQSQLKKVFSKLLEILLEDDIELKYSVSEDYTKGLYKDVCEEYIHDLNSEIANVKSQLSNMLN